MRAVFYVYLCLLLLCAVRTFYAGTHEGRAYSSSTSGPVKRQHVKLNNRVPSDSLLDDADIDTEDDYRSLDEDGGGHKFLSLHTDLAYSGYLTIPVELLSIQDNKRFKILPRFCGYSAPIYIRQRVLRV